MHRPRRGPVRPASAAGDVHPDLGRRRQDVLIANVPSLALRWQFSGVGIAEPILIEMSPRVCTSRLTRGHFVWQNRWARRPVASHLSQHQANLLQLTVPQAGQAPLAISFVDLVGSRRPRRVKSNTSSCTTPGCPPHLRLNHVVANGWYHRRPIH